MQEIIALLRIAGKAVKIIVRKYELLQKIYLDAGAMQGINACKNLLHAEKTDVLKIQ